MNVLCHDSDAPKSDRLAYVGTLNVNAGRKAGELVKALLPDGGKIMLFVGTLDAGNAQERRQGLLEAIEGTQIEVIDTRTDDTDRARAKANVEGTLTAHPDVACLVGLWEYNGPAILNALKDAEKAGKIPVVCFDENETTLEGIKDGLIHATVVQSPFEFGYQSVRILAALHKGDTSVIPENKILEIPVRVINQDNVVAFQKELEALRE
jgi:ribose transport system substrate-binding protein